MDSGLGCKFVFVNVPLHCGFCTVKEITGNFLKVVKLATKRGAYFVTLISLLVQQSVSEQLVILWHHKRKEIVEKCETIE